MRLFIAGYPPAPARADLAGYLPVLHAVRAGRRVEPADRWHLTLAFLGEVPDGRLPRVAAALDAALVGVRPPELRVAGGGSFGRGRCTVLWAGLTGEVRQLAGVGRTVRRELRRARLRYDERPLRPHLTLARPGADLPASALAEDLARLDRYQGPAWAMRELCVVRSYPGPDPRYEVLHTTRLAAG